MMGVRAWWARLLGRGTPRPGPAPVPEDALREIAAVHRRQHEAADRLSLVGLLGTVSDTYDPTADERITEATRRRVAILLEGERRVFDDRR